MWETPARLPGLSGPAVSGDVGVLGDGDAFDWVGQEERERQRTPLCDLMMENQQEPRSIKNFSKQTTDAGADFSDSDS